ncbi:MAG: group 1 truncated hemoglobin [Planctomycetaceae bacterium]|nr:group 1 truncated hemoglobin [Planctomycetaceae bacterium]
MSSKNGCLVLLALATGMCGPESQLAAAPRGRVIYYQTYTPVSCPPACQPAASATTTTVTAAKPATPTLYARLGGEPAIKAVVDDFVARASANPKVNVTRKGVGKEWNPTPENVAKLKMHLVNMIGMVTGGPQKYTGRDMKTAHAGMKITNAEFDAAAEDLVATLNKLKVPAAEQKELLDIIGTTRKDIVEKPLYERLGGEAAVKAVVDDFVARAASNPKVNFTRKGTDTEWPATPENVAKLKMHLVNMIGMVTGGPQKYTGRDMKAAHVGMKITNAEFDALAGDLIATLDKFKVPAAEKNELLTIIGSTRDAIVEVK